MVKEDEEIPQTKFTAMSDFSKELVTKGVQATKSSSKKALDLGKKITGEGVVHAKEGMNTLSKKKDEYMAKRAAEKLEKSISKLNAEKQASTDTLPERIEKKISTWVKPKPPANELEQIKEQMKQIEHDFPTVLAEVYRPPKRKARRPNWPNVVSSLLLFALALITLLHTFLGLSNTGDTTFIQRILSFIVPSWLSNSTAYGGFNQWPMVLGIATSTLLIVSGVLILLNSKLPAKLLFVHYGGVLCLGHLVFIFYSEVSFDSMIVVDAIRDALKAAVVVGIARSPHTISKILPDEQHPSIFEYSGILSEKGKKPNTSAELDLFIEEGLSMDFRTEVAKPKPPRARAKFETYEVILLCASFLLWPSTIVMTMALDNGLNVWTDYSSGPVQVGAMWALSLFTLLALVRFDRSARGNGWYAKEKETYVGMMDLYSKAQAKHYEYVELRAAAEAQEILEKYPQLDKTKSGVSRKA
jgi:hypothetical protein